MKNQDEDDKTTKKLVGLGPIGIVEFFKSVEQSQALKIMIALAIVLGGGFILFLVKMAGV
ncbi:hypothetical protein [Alteromonas antoniana]|uniref:hypothetical protein n=1 Tax=Alteromonas antoniana TaxID=2803813 RepID=UPI001C4912CD|nr:hypothetical protein [Alteromonas antoniana]